MFEIFFQTFKEFFFKKTHEIKFSLFVAFFCKILYNIFKEKQKIQQKPKSFFIFFFFYKKMLQIHIFYEKREIITVNKKNWNYSIFTVPPGLCPPHHFAEDKVPALDYVEAEDKVLVDQNYKKKILLI
jgi:hypothetical protein